MERAISILLSHSLLLYARSHSTFLATRTETTLALYLALEGVADSWRTHLNSNVLLELIPIAKSVRSKGTYPIKIWEESKDIQLSKTIKNQEP